MKRGDQKMRTMSVAQTRISFVIVKLSEAMRRPCNGRRSLITTSLLMMGLWLAVMATVITTSRTAAAQSVQFEEIGGTLPDGTEFLIRVPQNWNGTVINDLDYAGSPNSAYYMYWLGQGYATSGTERHPLRRFQYDPLGEVDNQVRVLDLLEARFGKPKRVIQYGQSGGGLVALGMAEVRPERVDGVVSACFQIPIPNHNMRVDTFFALKALIAPDSDLQIVDVPDDTDPIEAAWHETVAAAQQTPEGRARIALAMTLGQLASWNNPNRPRPDPRDIHAVQEEMFHSLGRVINQNFSTRFMMEQAGKGRMTWTTGVDYKDFFNNGDREQKRVVRALYREAGLDVQADLAQINQAPRIEPDLDVIDAFWRLSPRTLNGDPKVPVFHMGQIGDEQTSQVQMQGYEARVMALGLDHLYRQAVVEGAGHCGFTVSERAAAVETVMHRLDTGRWGNTSPQKLNDLASSLNVDEPRFIRHNWPKLNRAFFPDSEVDQ
jgi:pimeloyl-ACP methyl ester carboxylesterase